MEEQNHERRNRSESVRSLFYLTTLSIALDLIYFNPLMTGIESLVIVSSMRTFQLFLMEKLLKSLSQKLFDGGVTVASSFVTSFVGVAFLRLLICSSRFHDANTTTKTNENTTLKSITKTVIELTNEHINCLYLPCYYNTFFGKKVVT